MEISIISFTECGIDLSIKIKKVLKGDWVMLFTKCSHRKQTEDNKEVLNVTEGCNEWAKKQMEQQRVLVFIGACGIAVRAIAPYVQNKLYDSPVLVMDENGGFVIPILSGHVGGANEIAMILADKLSCIPVITTATDIRKQFAVDVFAKKNNLSIINKGGIVKVSSKVLAKEEIKLSIEPEFAEYEGTLPKCFVNVSYPPAEEVDILITSEKEIGKALLTLEPQRYVIGMGCKKGKEYEAIERYILDTIEDLGISISEIGALVSVDVKKEEDCFLQWSKKYRIPFVTYSAEELEKLDGEFNESPFVKKQIGVGNVCERAALRYCDGNGNMVYEKHAKEGMTIAIAKRKWRIQFD